MNAFTNLPIDYARPLQWYIVLNDEGYQFALSADQPDDAIVGPCDSPEEAAAALHLKEPEAGGQALGYIMCAALAVVSFFVGYFAGSL